jgi:hypothetical protein
MLGLGWKKVSTTKSMFKDYTFTNISFLIKWIRSKWNWFDGLIASSALFLMILRFASPDLWTIRVERYCLVLAAFRLGEGIDALQTLYHTIA